MSLHQTALLWFRSDLRLADNPALHDAVLQARQVIPVYVHDPLAGNAWPQGAASRWWLHHSLASLNRDLEALGSRLLLRQGNSLEVLRLLVRETGARCIVWNRRYEPHLMALDKIIEQTLGEDGVEVRSHNAHLLFEPWTLHNQQHKPYRVFTPFWQTCQQQLAALPAPQPAPGRLPAVPENLASETLQSFELLPSVRWDAGLGQRWKPGEQGAHQQLECFFDKGLREYATRRNFPAATGTSSLSPHLHFGEIGPRQIVAALAPEKSSATQAGAECYLREIVWREFAHHLLYHFPHTPQQPLDVRFNNFPWKRNLPALRAWQQGRTGIPLVDTGMRELWHTGWMHNRVRMIVASFLTKNLRIHWLEGARWFWDTLVDADLASNTLGWQWTAGCGADAAPYFRVFNPALQAERFDPDRAYIRRWVPELALLSDRWIHQPWAAPQAELARAGVEPGRTYPPPIVDLRQSREAALAAYGTIKSG